jgi:hypothetical protein
MLNLSWQRQKQIQVMLNLSWQRQKQIQVRLKCVLTSYTVQLFGIWKCKEKSLSELKESGQDRITLNISWHSQFIVAFLMSLQNTTYCDKAKGYC